MKLKKVVKKDNMSFFISILLYKKV